MKKFILSLAIAFYSYCSYAQNTFSSNGDAVLDRTGGYVGNALQFAGWGENHFIRTESIGNSSNGNTRLRMYLGDDWAYDQGFEIIASRWDGLQRSLFYIPGNGDNASFYSGATFGGNLIIGKTSQVNFNYKLDVNGNARANEIVVNSTGADFVFDKKYSLPKLSYIKSYIDEHHHLPEIPSAKEMQAKGLELGEMNTKLLQKVEELTLYAIQQREENHELKKVSQAQEARITVLEKTLLKQTRKHSK